LIQVVGQAGDASVRTCKAPTYHLLTGPLAFANNRHFLSFANTDPNGVVKLWSLGFISYQISAVPGVVYQMDLRRITGITGGAAVTPARADLLDPDLALFTAVSIPSSVAGESATLRSWIMSNEEGVTTNLNAAGQLFNFINQMPETGDLVKPLTFRQDEGFTVRTITNTTVGLIGVVAVITKE
jgi:hypothetical protein